MKKLILPLLAITISLSGCKKWLNVKPEDKFIEEEVFQTAQGFKDALNGMYLKLGSSDLYGNTLNLTTLDLLAQLYFITSNQNITRQQLVAYNYEEKESKKLIDDLWSNLYVNIANANRLLENLDAYGAVLDEQSRSIMKAEAHAVRAYLYFDVLRLFAPNFTKEPNAKISHIMIKRVMSPPLILRVCLSSKKSKRTSRLLKTF